LLILQKSVDR